MRVVQKLELTIKKYQPKTIAISGGVAANEKFRQTIQTLNKKYNIEVLIPKKEYSTDNAAMIAIAGYYKYKSGNFAKLSINVNPRYKLNKYE